MFERDRNQLLADLLKAVLQHAPLSRAELLDIAAHGADTGWAGFTYTGDCVAFYDRNETSIYELLAEEAEALGHPNIDALVSTFVRSDLLWTTDGRKNLLAWFALEQVARAVEEGDLAYPADGPPDE